MLQLEILVDNAISTRALLKWDSLKIPAIPSSPNTRNLVKCFNYCGDIRNDQLIELQVLDVEKWY